jgi:hypothetical protein
MKIEIILLVVLYGCETLSFTLREELRLREIGEKSVEEDIWPGRCEVTG